MMQGEILQFHNRPITEWVGKPGNDRSLELKHAGDNTAVIIKL
jgi:hypothetical protein